jgi:tetratricopeptide (TPR) repeat protein
MNERGKALGVLREARRRWPHDVDVLNALGVTQAAAGAWDDAIKVFAEATAVAPNETITYLNLGKSLEMRYFKLRRYLQAPRLWVTDERDREGALKNYEHYVAAGGPYAAQAREGNSRLKAVGNRPIP